MQCVAALVAHTRCDKLSQQRALERFVAAAGKPGAHVDVAFGQAGLLLGCSVLLEASAPSLEVGPLRSVGDALCNGLWNRLEGQARAVGVHRASLAGGCPRLGGVPLCPPPLEWGDVDPAAERIEERLGQRAAFGRLAGRGMRWPLEAKAAAPDSPLGASWCNGAAGYVHL